MEPINATEVLTFQQNAILFSGFVTWTVLGFFAIRILAPRLLPYVMVEEGEAMIVERWFKYNRTITKGSHFLIPFVETLKPVVWSYDNRQKGPVSIETCRIMTCKTKLQPIPIKVLTKDSQKVGVIFNITFIISDVKHVVYYHGNNLYKTIQKLVSERVRECTQSFPIENLTTKTLQISIEESLENTQVRQMFEKRGLSHVECHVVDIEYPAELTEKRERLEEVELQQELEERLFEQRSLLRKREFGEILQFVRQNDLSEVVLGKMLSSVIRAHQ